MDTPWKPLGSPRGAVTDSCRVLILEELSNSHGIMWVLCGPVDKKYTEPVSQETELQGCSIDGNLDSTESGAGGYASSFVKDPSRMESLLIENYTSRWSSKYLVRLSVHGHPCRADL